MALAAALGWSPVAARGAEDQAVPRSSSTSALGGGLNAWAGTDQARLRLVGSHVALLRT